MRGDPTVIQHLNAVLKVVALAAGLVVRPFAESINTVRKATMRLVVNA